MKPVLYLNLAFALALLTLLTCQPGVFAQGTAFLYQGQLAANGAPANGSYDMIFALYATNTSGSAVAGPITNSATSVSNGLFSATIDFGAGVFSGSSYWLDISVSPTGSNTFTELTPRQPILPAPYAIMANSASNLLGTLPAAQLGGTIPLAQLPSMVVTNGSAGINISGTFSGNGAGLTNIPTTGIQPYVLPLSIGPVPNMAINVNLVVTNNSFIFGNPTGVTPGAFNYDTILVSNTAGSVITLTPAPAWSFSGTPNVTNVTVCYLWTMPYATTNVIFTPIR